MLVVALSALAVLALLVLLGFLAALPSLLWYLRHRDTSATITRAHEHGGAAGATAVGDALREANRHGVTPPGAWVRIERAHVELDTRDGTDRGPPAAPPAVESGDRPPSERT